MTTTDDTVKVKIYYTTQGSKLMKLTTTTTYNNTNVLSLRSCLWSICTASPDIICKDHDLSIYTANLTETDPSEGTINHDSLIWEGHGLMSWIMDPNQSNDIYVSGKRRVYETDSNQHVVELHVNLQPTLKWSKDDFVYALKNEKFCQLKEASLTPKHQQQKQCNCYDTGQKVEHANDHSMGALGPPASLPVPSGRMSARNTMLPSLSASVPPVLHRPEPIFPQVTTSMLATQANIYRIPSPPFHDVKEETDNAAVHVQPLQQQQQQQQQSYPYRQEFPPPVPIPTSSIVPPQGDHRKSAFTLAAGSSGYKRKSSDSHKSACMITSMPLSSSPNKQPLSSATSYSSSSASSSPVHSAASPTTLKDGMMHHQNQSHHPLTERCSDTNVNHGHRKRRKKGSSTWKDPTVSPAASTTLHGDQQRSCSFSQHSQPPSSSSTTHLIPITPPPPLSVATPTSALAPAPSQQQHISTAVRTYYEVDKDRNGNYILPVEIDSWTVIDLGTVVYDRPAYHNQRYIYPVNYTVKKWYRSMIDPQSDTQYTCRILDNGREPKFEVTADDCDMTYSGPTPTTVWTIIVRRAFSIRNQEYGHNPVGPDFFGLRKNTIAKMIQDLPNASQCSRYVWQNFEPAKFNKPGSRTRRRTESSSGKGLQHPYGLVKEGATATTTTREGDDLSSTNMSYRHRPITCIAAASLSTLTGGLNYGLTHGHRSSQQQTASNTIKRGKKN